MSIKKIVLLAYVCSPYKGSEEGSGWNRSVGLSRYFETHVLVGHAGCYKDIQTYLQGAGVIPNLHFHYVEHTKFENLIMQFTPLFYIGYNLWHRNAYRAAKKLHEQHGFSLAHMMTFCGFREPGYLWKLPIPFIWGPVGGVQNYPWKFICKAGLKGAITEAGRSILNTIQLKTNMRVRKAMSRASTVLAANKKTAVTLKKVFSIDSPVAVEIGLQKNVISKPAVCTKTLKILWSGVFEHRKALYLLLQACADLPPHVNFELHILGKGPLEKTWRNLACKLDISKHIQWLGWLPLQEALSQFTWADIFSFTSLRDTTGTVLLEALSYGLPIVTLDHQGAADIVTSECGFKIPVHNPDATILGIHNAIVQLNDDKTLLARLSEGAIERAQDFLWERQIDTIRDVYELNSKEVSNVD